MKMFKMWINSEKTKILFYAQNPKIPAEIYLDYPRLEQVNELLP